MTTLCRICKDFNATAKNECTKWTKHADECLINHNAKYEQMIVALRVGYSQEIDTIRTKHNDKLTSIRTSHEEDLDTLNNRNQALSDEIKGLKAEVSRLQRDLKSTNPITTINNKRGDDEIAKVRKLMNLTVAQRISDPNEGIDTMIKKLDVISEFKCIYECPAIIDTITSVIGNPQFYYHQVNQ
jgi:dynactin complex subunit